jgi:hypothetical protein
MPELLQATKITRNGRIPLGQKAMDYVDAKVGDYVHIFEQDGVLWRIKGIAPPMANRTVEAAHVCSQ